MSGKRDPTVYLGFLGARAVNGTQIELHGFIGENKLSGNHRDHEQLILAALSCFPASDEKSAAQMLQDN